MTFSHSNLHVPTPTKNSIPQRIRQRYRSRMEIVVDFLRAVDTTGATKRMVQYRSMLSWKQISLYIAVLVDNGLLEYREDPRKHHITEKGKNFIRMNEEIIDLLDNNSNIIPSLKPNTTDTNKESNRPEPNIVTWYCSDGNTKRYIHLAKEIV